MAEQATLALQDNNWEKAERILNRALELIPDSPGLLNNLAVAYELQGRTKKAHAMVREINERFPDYLFARVTVARMAITDGDLDRAHDLLDPLLQRKKLHFSEFNKLVAALIELYLAEDGLEAARGWINMWEQVEPDAAQLSYYKMRVGMPRLSQLLTRRRS